MRDQCDIIRFDLMKVESDYSMSSATRLVHLSSSYRSVPLTLIQTSGYCLVAINRALCQTINCKVSSNQMSYRQIQQSFIFITVALK